MPTRASASLRTWGLALIFILMIDAALTRTPVLWSDAVLVDRRDGEQVFMQTHHALRVIYARDAQVAHPVALIGNSRLLLATRPRSLERELDRLAPELAAPVEQLAIFGAGPVTVERLSRHLDRLEPRLIVLAINGADLSIAADWQMESPAYRLLSIGWSDGPVTPQSWSRRADRWLRTVWRLWRFRELTRAALEERVWPPPPAAPMPERFRSTQELFAFARGPARAVEIEAAYRRWREEPSLERFVQYLEIGHPRHLRDVRERASVQPRPVDLETNARALDAVLATGHRQGWPLLVVLLPENPLFELDRKGELHRPGLSERGASRIREIAARYGIDVVDARRWLPAESFMDLDHLLYDLGGFEPLLAREIRNALTG